MKRCVAAESGAPPDSSTRVFPPRSARTRLNTSLRGAERDEDEDTAHEDDEVVETPPATAISEETILQSILLLTFSAQTQNQNQYYVMSYTHFIEAHCEQGSDDEFNVCSCITGAVNGN